MERDKEIIELRKRKIPLKEIGKRFNITPERARQIYEKRKLKYCKVHKSPYQKECEYCQIQLNYTKRIQQFSVNRLFQEVLDLSKEDRNKKTVIKRQILIKFLKDTHKLNYSELGELLSRDHSSIKNLYEKD